jgi:Tfp pilus assembly protein PilN
MINLLPDSAKRVVVIEYWQRVLTVWLALIMVGSLVGALLLLPSYVLIQGQVAAYEQQASRAASTIDNYESVSRELIAASRLAERVIKEANITSFVDVFQQLESHVDANIYISSLRAVRDDEVLKTIQITGRARSPEALAAYQDRLELDPLVAEARLPISDLTPTANNTFSVLVTLDTE